MGNLVCANPNSTYLQPSRCVFQSPSAGDPCADDLDCVGGRRTYNGIVLHCDATVHACLPRNSMGTCYEGACIAAHSATGLACEQRKWWG